MMSDQCLPVRKMSTAAQLCVVLIAGATLSGGSVSAAKAQSQLCEPGSVVYYVNGIRTNFGGAAADLGVLKSLINLSQTTSGRPVSYEFTHNPDNGFINDFRETLVQWISQDNPNRGNVRESIDRLRAAAEDGRLTALLVLLQNSVDPRIRISANVASALRAFILSETARLLAAHSRAAAIAGTVKGAMTTFIDRGNMVVLVTHSQGNFVGNAAFDLLPGDKRQYVSMVSVATPANHVSSSNGVHFTLDRDVISNVPSSLPTNVAQSADCPQDPDWNHSFSYCYASPWSGSDASARLRGAVVERINQAPPAGIIANGVVVGTLRWGAQPDVDLHAFEPSGTHVFYNSPNGPTARLDRDDTTSFGPENIYVCNDPTVGTYRFGVNYYAGTGPETANVELSAGGVRRQMPSIGLASARGSGGNNSPVPAGAVVVTRDAQGRISYRIQ